MILYVKICVISLCPEFVVLVPWLHNQATDLMAHLIIPTIKFTFFLLNGAWMSIPFHSSPFQLECA